MPRAKAFEHWTTAALEYAELGWYVIPVEIFETETTLGKTSAAPETGTAPAWRTRFQDWRSEASRSEQTISSWADLWEHSEIGVVTGLVSGIVILEVDRDAGGEETLQELCGGERLPVTPCYYWEARKLYHVFKHPGVLVPSKVVLGEGVTLYGDDSVVPVPPFLYYAVHSPIRWYEYPEHVTPPPVPARILRAANVEVPSEYYRDAGAVTSPARPAGPRLNFASAASLVQRATAGTRWIAPPWAACGSLSVLVGTSKTAGKTTWLLELARAVLSGGSFLGGACNRSPVVYLTEQSRPSFCRALQRAGIIDRRDLHRLHILHAADAESLAWDQLVDGVIRECEIEKARLVIIDSLDAFAGLGTDVAQLSDPAFLGPLRRAVEQGLAIVATYQQYESNQDLEGRMHALGRLASLADTVMRLSRIEGGRQNDRKIETVSRFEEAQGVRYIRYENGAYHLADNRPLFERVSNSSDNNLFSSTKAVA